MNTIKTKRRRPHIIATASAAVTLCGLPSARQTCVVAGYVTGSCCDPCMIAHEDKEAMTTRSHDRPDRSPRPWQRGAAIARRCDIVVHARRGVVYWFSNYEQSERFRAGTWPL